MINVHLIPIIYVGIFVMIKIALARLLKVDKVKSESFKI